MTEVRHHALLSVVLWPPSDTVIHTHRHAIGWQRPAQGFNERGCCEASIRQKTPGVRPEPPRRSGSGLPARGVGGQGGARHGARKYKIWSSPSQDAEEADERKE